MIHVECAVPIRARRADAWRVLRAKVESPQRFLPRVVACEVLERREDEVVRRVTFDDGVAVTERVVLVPEEAVIFRLVDHPKFDGEIRNVLFETGDTLWLSFYFQGTGKPGVELGHPEYEQLRDGFARAVLTAARQIEEGEPAFERT
ncbi:MAG TPA: AtaL-like protein [Longimicrobiales bacterium]